MEGSMTITIPSTKERELTLAAASLEYPGAAEDEEDPV